MGTSTGEVPSPESFPGKLRDGPLTQLAARRHFLIDCREELPSYSAGGLAVGKGCRSRHHVRISCGGMNRPKDEFDRGAFLEICATNRGYQLKAFREFEAAFTWLTFEEPEVKAGT